MAIQSYRDFMVWQKGMELAEGVYRVTEAFPNGERFGLTGQIRPSAVSIPSNIAEGHRRTRRDFTHFISIAQGLLAELETQLLLPRRLNYITDEQANGLLDAAGENGPYPTRIGAQPASHS